MDELLGYIDPYWHELIRSAHLGVGHRLYPESEPMSARPQARAAGSFPPRSYEELRAQLLEPHAPRAVILTCVATFAGSRNPYFEAAMTTAVNNWLADEFLGRDDRLRGSIVVPSLPPGGRRRSRYRRTGSHSPDRAVRAGAAAGLRSGVGVRYRPIHGQRQPVPAADESLIVGLPLSLRVVWPAPWLDSLPRRFNPGCENGGMDGLACPCGLGDDYDACCGRLHAGAPAPTAEALMRARYSAFAVGDARLPAGHVSPVEPPGGVLA